jgi:hypothetical protein
MSDRIPTDTVQLKVRMRESLRAALAWEAENAKHSLNAEIVTRLERSFELELTLEGQEIFRIARIVASAFALAGMRRASARGIGESPRAWIDDEECYRAATRHAIKVLQAGLEVDDEERDLQSLLSRHSKTGDKWGDDE